MVAAEVDAWDSRDNNIYQLDSIHKALVVVEGTRHQMGSLLLEWQKEFDFFNVNRIIQPLENICGVTLSQACLHQSLSQIPSSSHYQNLLFSISLILLQTLIISAQQIDGKLNHVDGKKSSIVLFIFFFAESLR